MYKTRLLNHRNGHCKKISKCIQFEFKCFTDKMFVRLLSTIIILVQVLESSNGAVVIERARMQHYMYMENDKIIHHLQGVDLQDLNFNAVLRSGNGQSTVPENFSRSQSGSVVNETCKPGEWRDYWGRCRELY